MSDVNTTDVSPSDTSFKFSMEDWMSRLRNRRIIITGAASGIGNGIATLFLSEGAQVGLIDRDEDRLRAAVAALGAGVKSAVADVSSETQVHDAVDRLASMLGGIDGIVNCAGIDLLRPFSETTSADWRAVLDVNLSGPFNVCSAALLHLKKSGAGTIVNISSAAGLRPLEHRTAYCTSKAALIMFSKTLAWDLAADNVRVNAICPGIIETALFRTSYEGHSDPEMELNRIKDRYLIKRVGTPEEIAFAALYLTSDESSYTTGTALAVDGGRTFH
jgi:NAD(P)-dependent dehydrogenase (short-subunit alcohol dehydrogenase family)